MYNCKFTSENAPEKSFRQYPKDIKVRDAWIKRIRKEHFEPSEHSYVSRTTLQMKISDSLTRTLLQNLQKLPLNQVVFSTTLRGQGTDERIPQRNSLTFTKARSTPLVEDRASNVGQIHPHVYVNNGPPEKPHR